MNERHIRNALIGILWAMSITLTWMAATERGDIDRDIKIAKMLLKTKLCATSTLIDATWSSDGVKVTCLSKNALKQRRVTGPKKPYKQQGNKS